MFPALGSLLAKSVAPAVAEQLARHGLQALQVRLRRDPSLAPATSAEIVAAVNHYNAAPERAWTRERLFEFVAFFVSAGPDGEVGWIEAPERIADYVLRGPRPGEDPATDRAGVAAALEREMEAVRALMARYLELLAAEPASAPEPSSPSAEPEPSLPVPAEAEADPRPARLRTALAQARERVRLVNEQTRRATEQRRARALVGQSLRLLHAGGVGLAQAEAYLLRKGYPAQIVRAVVAERISAG